MRTTFYNVTITIEAETPVKAYGALCEALSEIGEPNVTNWATDWATDTYSVDAEGEDQKDTEELMVGYYEEGVCQEHIHIFDVDCEVCRTERLQTDVRTR